MHHQMPASSTSVQVVCMHRNTIHTPSRLPPSRPLPPVLQSAIPHPRIMGIIRECGGKMHMHDQLWAEAATDFFEVTKRGAGGPEGRGRGRLG